MTPWLWWLLLYRVKRFSLEYRKISIMASKLNARYLLILREVKSKTNCDSLSRFLRVFCQLRVFSSSFDWLIGWFACFVIGQGDNNNGCRFRAAVESMKSGNYFGFGFGSTAVWDWLRSQNCCVDGFVSVNNIQLKTALFPRLQRFFFIICANLVCWDCHSYICWKDTLLYLVWAFFSVDSFSCTCTPVQKQQREPRLEQSVHTGQPGVLRLHHCQCSHSGWRQG